ncbi:tumor necrosis factor receptor superfamily member 14-like [Trichosurus vulpecula]|uniref:tumor necrosis factor receptor superfamily member 14-like n=1 Tax=Trichosurus vulpecula TaxID=9337 RepID=UPI00186B1EBC|nr:tumor necrosis factor receptor superfamily member 14-like [Trichosurus vulpecula]
MVNRGYLMIFSMFTMAQLIPFKKALECMVAEYEVDGQCCPTCRAGYRVNETCTIMTGTTCVACDPGTYTAHQSGLKECLQCKVCDSESGLVTRRECSSTSNTVCGCSPGYFCTGMKNDCEMCVRHQVCIPGQYVKSRGTERSNTICEACQAGTFSPNGTLDQCLPWTNCTAQGLSEEMPGTDTTDALCSSESTLPFMGSVIAFTIIIILIFGMVFVKGNNNQKRGDDTRGRAEASHPEKTLKMLSP